MAATLQILTVEDGVALYRLFNGSGRAAILLRKPVIFAIDDLTNTRTTNRVRGYLGVARPTGSLSLRRSRLHVFDIAAIGADGIRNKGEPVVFGALAPARRRGVHQAWVVMLDGT